MQNFMLYKNHLISYLDLFGSSRAIEQFLFLHHFWIIFGSICQINFGAQSVQVLSCNASYEFDYLDEKQIFFDETKTAEQLLVKSILWLQIISISILGLYFFNQFQIVCVNDEPARLYFSISYFILEHILMACNEEVHAG